MRITDSHFHIEMTSGADLNFLSGGIDAGCTLDDIENRKTLLEPYPHISQAAAMGPWCAADMKEEEIPALVDSLEKKIKENGISFLGETGLDYYWNYGTPELQKELFEQQIKLADRLGLRILVHSRNAAEDTAKIIRRTHPSRAGVIHCFDGSSEILNAALECGFWISFAGNLTYKSNSRLREMLVKVPSDKLLLETDSPYLSPVPLRGKPNKPENIVYTYQCAAEVLGIDVERLAEQVYSNFSGFVKPRS